MWILKIVLSFLGKVIAKVIFGNVIFFFLKLAWLEKIVERCLEKKRENSYYDSRVKTRIYRIKRKLSRFEKRKSSSRKNSQNNFKCSCARKTQENQTRHEIQKVEVTSTFCIDLLSLLTLCCYRHFNR